MLELLDTGRMAYKFGKWRAAMTDVYATGLALLSTAVGAMGELVSQFGASGDTTGANSPIDWSALGLSVMATLMLFWGGWQLYRDVEHGDYRRDASRYKHEGW